MDDAAVGEGISGGEGARAAWAIVAGAVGGLAGNVVGSGADGAVVQAASSRNETAVKKI